MADTEQFANDDSSIPPPVQERRQALRRADDIAVGHMAWLEWIVLHRGALASLAAIVGSVITFLATTMAMRQIGQRDMQSLTHTVAQHDSALVSLDRRMSAAEESQRFQDYLSCVLVRRVEPNALPPKCQTVINNQVAP